MSGTKTAPKVVPVHEIKWDASLLFVLPASHGVTGCDTVSPFAGHDNVTACENNSQPLTGIWYGQLTNKSVDYDEKFVYQILDPSTGSQILTKC